MTRRIGIPMHAFLDISRDALRGLRASRGTTTLAIAMLTIALAAGAVTYSVVDAIALRPLPLADPDRLVAVGLLNDTGSAAGDATSQDFFAWKDRVPALEAMGAYRRTILAPLDLDGTPRTLALARVTPGFLDLAGARPELGRLFDQEHDGALANGAIVLSASLWRTAFNADRSVVGRSVTVGKDTRTIVGVLAPGFSYPVAPPRPVDGYIPVAFAPDERVEPATRVSFNMQVVGRLRPGATIPQVQQQIDLVNQARPGFKAGRRTHLVLPLLDRLVGPAKMWLLLVLAAVGFVLLVACVNVANLLLARATVRTRELATREVLGASRGRIVATLVGEGVLIATAAGSAGLSLAFLLLDTVKAVLPDGLVRASTIGLDARILGISIVVIYACGLAFASAPAWLSSRSDLFSATRSNAGASSARRGGSLAPGALLVAEMAFVTTLLVAATTLVTSFVLFTTADLGYDRRNLAAFGVQRSFESTPAETRTAAAATFRTELLRGVEAIPGVTGAALIRSGLPLSGGSTSYPASLPGAKAARVSAASRVVSPEYFRVMDLRVLSGRAIEPSDGVGAPGVAVISDAFAARYFDGQPPVGQAIQIRGLRTIVGVVRGVHMFGPNSAPEPEIYLPVDQDSIGTDEAFDLVVRSSAPAATLGASVRAAVAPLVGGGEFFEARFLEDNFRRLSADRRFNAGLMTAFGLVAIVIGVIGIYGTMAFEVAQQSRAIGIRLALGAPPERVRRHVVGGAIRRAAIGAGMGLAGAWAMSAMLTSLVFGVTPTSPAIYAGVALLVLIAATGGALIPAVRASRIDPLLALRAE